MKLQYAVLYNTFEEADTDTPNCILFEADNDVDAVHVGPKLFMKLQGNDRNPMSSSLDYSTTPHIVRLIPVSDIVKGGLLVALEKELLEEYRVEKEECEARRAEQQEARDLREYERLKKKFEGRA